MDVSAAQPVEPSASRRPAWARWVTGISLAIAAVALVLTIRKTGVRALGHYFERIGWFWIGVVVLESAVTCLDAIAMRAFLSPEQDRVPLRTALLAQLSGRAVNAVTPFGQLGEAIKVSVLVEKVSQSRAVACILLYNVVGFTVELGQVAIAAPLMVLFMPLPTQLRWVFLIGGFVALVLALGLYFLVRRGVLTSLVSVPVRLKIISAERFMKWKPRLLAVDDKMRRTNVVRARDRWIGVTAMVLSRGTSMMISIMLLYALGEPLTIGFIAGLTVGGFFIYMLSSLVPMGLGVGEGGYYELFRALGENPARGVALQIARRATIVAYAAIGIVLMTASETVQRARDRQRAPAELPTATALPTPITDAK